VVSLSNPQEQGKSRPGRVKQQNQMITGLFGLIKKIQEWLFTCSSKVITQKADKEFG